MLKLKFLITVVKIQFIWINNCLSILILHSIFKLLKMCLFSILINQLLKMLLLIWAIDLFKVYMEDAFQFKFSKFIKYLIKGN
jgi:hypothetical protein